MAAASLGRGARARGRLEKDGEERGRQEQEDDSNAACSLPAVNRAVPHQVTDAGVLLLRAHELKEDGNRLFQSRDYVGALCQYELELCLALRVHPDRAVFHSSCAACLLQLRPVDHEAIAQECSLTL
jgi:hypothetical protein